MLVGFILMWLLCIGACVFFVVVVVVFYYELNALFHKREMEKRDLRFRSSSLALFTVLRPRERVYKSPLPFCSILSSLQKKR
jgi:hypothetical protein